ncbi:unnamed protein product [Rhodiola kirilowii]
MMDEDMEFMDVEVFRVDEIDLDYEFDACKFYDFCKEETYWEQRQAEWWFDSAPDYPPSPFVDRLNLHMSFLENVNEQLQGAVEENTTLHSYQGSVSQMSVLDASARGLTFYNHMAKDVANEKPKPRMKSISRNSTLMKPTASQLAKQNKPHQNFGTRFNTPLVQTCNKSMNNSSGIESQAPKRQKLDGGQLHKIIDMKQPSPLVHKAPKKDGIIDFNSNAKLKLTIPREPEFVTRQRVQMPRSRNKTIPEQASPTAHSFRARPLNRKILDAPSMPLAKKSAPRLPEFQEFYLRTAERSAQHASAVQSPSLQCGNIHEAALPRPNHCSFTSKRVDNDNKSRQVRNGTSQQDECGATHMFKALPVNKKIFSSKGEFGVGRSTKRNATIPVEFKFETERRIQNCPPVDLFSKLSLAPELQPTNGNEKLSRLTFATVKGTKENKVSSRQEHEMTNTDRERTPRFWRDQLHCGSDRIAVQSAPQAGRWLGIR